VQTYARVGLPPITTRTRCRFGSKRRFVATIEWLRWWPKPGFLPQIAQILDIGGQDSRRDLGLSTGLLNENRVERPGVPVLCDAAVGDA